MSLLTYVELVQLVEQGVIDAPLENINQSSIDITLGDTIYHEALEQHHVIDLAKKDSMLTREELLTPHGVVLAPGEFILAATRETFNLPNDITADYRLKSSLARCAVDHKLGGWCDPGWNGSNFTLPLTNGLQYQCIRLTPGMKIGQMIFFKGTPVPEEMSYANTGQYNGKKGPAKSEGVK